MRIAVLDLGTNTFHLLIAEVSQGVLLKKIYKDRREVKLLKGSGTGKHILPQAFFRGIDVLKAYHDKIHEHRVVKIFAFGTSALRSADNGEEFRNAAKEQTGIDIQIITGGQEATLIYEGVKQSLKLGEGNSLILDIGGGSNEFVICDRENMLWAKSYNLGAARMLEKFKLSDPVTPSEIDLMNRYFDLKLSDLFEATRRYPIKTLIGSSGSFDTFAELICARYLPGISLKGATEFSFDLNHFAAVSKDIIGSTLEERLAMHGMARFRADMIVIACVFTNFVLRRLDIRSMRLSKGALKEGALQKIIENSSFEGN